MEIASTPLTSIQYPFNWYIPPSWAGSNWQSLSCWLSLSQYKNSQTEPTMSLGVWFSIGVQEVLSSFFCFFPSSSASMRIFTSVSLFYVFSQMPLLLSWWISESELDNRGPVKEGNHERALIQGRLKLAWSGHPVLVALWISWNNKLLDYEWINDNCGFSGQALPKCQATLVKLINFCCPMQMRDWRSGAWCPKVAHTQKCGSHPLFQMYQTWTHMTTTVTLATLWETVNIIK